MWDHNHCLLIIIWIVPVEDTKSYTAKEEVNCTSSNNTTYDTNNQSLLQDIHKKVTNYILKLVDIQIQKLDVDENEQKRSINKQNTEDRKENNHDLEQTNQEKQRRNHNELVNNSNNHRNNPYNDHFSDATETCFAGLIEHLMFY
jgi:competence protein ComGC